MEVHHHPHVEKKNFKEYFLEFLMIFLAVTMGFFAENIREYISDREREHANINSLVKNLGADSMAVESSLQSIDNGKIRIDTLMQLIRSQKYNSEQEMFYRLAYQTRGFLEFGYSNVTFQQMQSSGSFGLIRNEGIRNDLVNYNNFISTDIKELETRMFETEKNQADWQNNILNDTFYPSVDSIINHHALKRHFFTPGNHTSVISAEQSAQFLKLYNLLFERNVIFNYYRLELAKLKDENKKLIAAIKKEYGLE
ncbi:MAG TPA: hypothetical protein VKR53_16860 [Puia sp.]|nr:hypothetical protein [Puia sp.]